MSKDSDGTVRESLLTRRSTLSALALGSLVAMGSVRMAEAAEMNEREKSNLDTALAFLKLWGDPMADGKKLADYLTEDCVVITEESKPATHGRAAAETLFAGYMARGRIDMKIDGSFAFGPVVLVAKRDSFMRDGKPGNYNPFAGLFIMKDGKIKEWTEYSAKI